MSGRGLGHTGGTLDKLESIPGMRIELGHDEFLAQVDDVGMAIIGQTADLVPADKRLYALRDVTSTVDNVSLIAASIMSKKIAAGADAIVLDVKVGDGAFMKTLDGARELAELMIELGRRAGREIVCELTDMDQPLGRAVGNALEIREAVETLGGNGPPDLVELVLGSAAHLLALSDLGVDYAEGRRRAENAVTSGAAAEAYERWIAAQGGDPSIDALPRASVVREVAAAEAGFIAEIATTSLGHAALRLGAGRTRKDEAIDHAVGVVCVSKRGDRVAQGDVLAVVHAHDEETADRAVAAVASCYELAPDPPQPVPIVRDVIA
jgi:pyrimidine-nucleoside phosphorylase